MSREVKGGNLILSGFTIIGERESTVWPDAIAIIGMRRHEDGPEYVTAIVGSLSDEEWNWGHYSGSHFGPGLGAAVLDWQAR